jgi:hypothetical protein
MAGPNCAIYGFHVFARNSPGRSETFCNVSKSRILATAGPNNVFQYDVTVDGQRFLINTTVLPEAGAASPPLTVVVNWNAALKK